MLARLQQIIIFGSAVFSSTWAVVWLLLGHPVAGLLPGIVLLLCYPTFIAAELLIASKVSRPVEESANLARFGEMLCAWWGEVLLAPRILCWRQPLREYAEPDNLSATSIGSRGVVLVHGLVCNRAFWNPWMRALRASQTPFVAVNLEPLFDSIDRYASIIDEAVAAVTAATGRLPVLVGHSMGGLAIRHWLLQQADAAIPPQVVHHVITIGTPHRGTWLARYATTTNGREMAVGSPWLERLETRPGAAVGALLFTCFYGNCDNVVFPPSLATLPGADNRLLRATAHMKLVFRDEIFNELRKYLADTEPKSASLGCADGNVKPQS